MTTISEAIDAIYDAISAAGYHPERIGIHDDEDMTIFALNFLLANIDEAFDIEEEASDDNS